MLERELTLQNGIISKNLPKGVVWLRLGDTGKTTFNKLGCDGFLFLGLSCWVTEVKMNTEKLTQSEEKLQKWCLDNKVNYLIMRYHEKLKLWELQLAGTMFSVGSLSLGECIESLIDL